MDPSVLKTYEASLARCDQNPVFLDRFYETFLAASPRVAEKFARTDFTGQKRALRESLNSMLMAAADPDHPEQYLRDIAERHSSRQLAVGAEFYDYGPAVGPDARRPINAAKKRFGEEELAVRAIKDIEEPVAIGMQQ